MTERPYVLCVRVSNRDEWLIYRYAKRERRDKMAEGARRNGLQVRTADRLWNVG